MSLRIGVAAAWAVAAVVVVPGSAAAGRPSVAGRVVAEVQRPTPISGFGRHLAYSAWDGARFRLVIWDARTGLTRTPDVRSRRVPFDVDLGPDGSGRTVAVYSRCSVEPYYDAGFAISRWTYVRGRGCDIFRLDLATGRERRVKDAARANFSEMLPTVWRDRIAFVRSPKGWTERSRPQIRVVAPGEPMRSISGGSYDFRTGPTKLDSYGRRVVFEWETQPHRCTGPDEQSGSNDGNEIWLADVTLRRRERVARFCIQDRGPGILRSRPSLGSLGLVTLESRSAGSDAKPGGSAVTLTVAPLGSPRRSRPVAPAVCVGDVTQLDGAIAVIDRNGAPCGVEVLDRVARVIPQQ